MLRRSCRRNRACGEADAIGITSTSPGTQRLWSGAGTFDLKDVSVHIPTGELTALGIVEDMTALTDGHPLVDADRLP